MTENNIEIAAALLLEHWALMERVADAYIDQGALSNHPPAANSTLEVLPLIQVDENDLQHNQKNDCTVCLEELVVGELATRIPCGHLFHERCLRGWLQKKNQCPTCRFELPSDSPPHESRRQARIRRHKPRAKRADLETKNDSELRFLANFFGINISGCRERVEIIYSIISSGA